MKRQLKMEIETNYNKITKDDEIYMKEEILNVQDNRRLNNIGANYLKKRSLEEFQS